MTLIVEVDAIRDLGSDLTGVAAEFEQANADKERAEWLQLLRAEGLLDEAGATLDAAAVLRLILEEE